LKDDECDALVDETKEVELLAVTDDPVVITELN
jgi:hypothetical protein